MTRAAIQTIRLKPTSCLGPRIKASAWRIKGLILPLLREVSNEQDHIRIAKLLAKRCEWKGLWIGGATEKGYSWVWARDGWVPSHQTWFIVD